MRWAYEWRRCATRGGEVVRSSRTSRWSEHTFLAVSSQPVIKRCRSWPAAILRRRSVPGTFTYKRSVLTSRFATIRRLQLAPSLRLQAARRPVLSAVNQGAVITGGDATPVT